MSICPPPELLTDRYQLAMAASYLAQGTADDRVAFELFVRELPRHRGYLIAAGLETAVGYLQSLRFQQSSLDYLKRFGTATAAAGGACRPALRRRPGRRRRGHGVHAGEPLLRVEGRG